MNLHYLSLLNIFIVHYKQSLKWTNSRIIPSLWILLLAKPQFSRNILTLKKRKPLLQGQLRSHRLGRICSSAVCLKNTSVKRTKNKKIIEQKKLVLDDRGKDVYCILYIVYCILYNVYCILYILYCILYIVYCILYIVYCILYIVYCILYIVYCIVIHFNTKNERGFLFV